jgi:hypothetical protein
MPFVESDAEAAKAMQSMRSQYREKMIEHVFVAEMWKEAWFRRKTVMEVLRSEVDGSGFDILLECQGVQRHIQLKATEAKGKARRQDVNTILAKRAGGCVVWIFFDGDSVNGLTSLRYWFFGGQPGENLPPLGDKVAHHSKANMQRIKGERPGIRVLGRGAFTQIASSSDLFTTLFGPERRG